MSQPSDRLYELLPAVYRQRDEDQGHTLQALLRVIAEQVDVVEADIEQLYENWFIETCQDWVVPYIGELIGYDPVSEMIPRREVANTIGLRRRRGTLLAAARQGPDGAGWPARAVEFYAKLGWTQSLTHVNRERGAIADLRDSDALERLDGAFEALAHTVDTRRLTAESAAGRFNLTSVALYVWTVRSYSVTMRQPYSQEGVGPQCYTFSALGNDLPLFARGDTGGANVVDDELQVPEPIHRRRLERRLDDYYGEGRSVAIWRAKRGGKRELVPAERIVVTDLTDWAYRVPRGKVALDPELGRIAFPTHSAELPKHGIWVLNHYGFSADVGGGEYTRTVSGTMPGTRIYQVGEHAPFERISEALDRWRQEEPRRAVIEIVDSAVYVEPIVIELCKGQSLELRAASGSAPVLRLLDWQTAQPDHLTVAGEKGSCFVLDGLLVAGRGVRITKHLARLIVRHCTLVPGWSLQPDCEPQRPAEPSLELEEVDTRVTIDHSIVGSIQVWHDEVRHDPVPIEIRDSIVDATSTTREAVSAPDRRIAHVALDVRRCTVIGEVGVHALTLGENSIFDGVVRVARRQLGCVRFCWVEPGSRTPRRYRCQPDLVVAAVDDEYARGELTAHERDRARERETLRVRPELVAARYGLPGYCRLALTCAAEIRRGADDESELGVFHDLFVPQRLAIAQSRLEQFTPATADAAVIIANEERI